MKRTLLVILGIVLVAIIATLWWFFRDTSEKVLRDGLRNLMAAESVEEISAELSWTDLNSRVTKGINFIGQMDSKDLTRPQVLGVFELGEGVVKGEQVADLIVTQNKIALRPRRVTTEYMTRYQDLVDDPDSASFAEFLRDNWLDEKDFGHFIAQGKSKDIRDSLPAFMQVVQVAGKWEKKKEIFLGREKVSAQYVTVPFRISGSVLEPFLVSILRVWHGDNPSPTDLKWIERTGAGIDSGLFKLTIDKKTRVPVLLSGEWLVLDDDGNELHRVRIAFEFQGVNKPVNILIPQNAVDVTAAVLKKPVPGASLPNSLERAPAGSGTAGTPALPSGADQSIIFNTTDREYIDVENIDLWHKYMEDLKKKKDN